MMRETVVEQLRAAIAKALPEAVITVGLGAGGGHYTVAVQSAEFAGKSMVQSHQLVYAAVAPLMAGDNAPVHAIDTLHTSTPS